MSWDFALADRGPEQRKAVLHTFASHIQQMVMQQTSLPSWPQSFWGEGYPIHAFFSSHPADVAPLLSRKTFSFLNNNSFWRLPPDDVLPKVTRLVWSQHRAAPKKKKPMSLGSPPWRLLD